MANEQNLKPFQKGDDPRRNRNGRPKSFDALRKLAQQVATEDVKQGGQPLIIDGHKVTGIEAVMQARARSKNPRGRGLLGAVCRFQWRATQLPVCVLGQPDRS